MSGYLNWHVGMKIVCIDADDAPMLTVGNVYTVKKMGVGSGLLKGRTWSGVTVSVEEAMGVTEWGFTHDDGFAVSRFRPVQTRKTDISVFTAMLKSTDKKVPA